VLGPGQFSGAVCALNSDGVVVQMCTDTGWECSLVPLSRQWHSCRRSIVHSCGLSLEPSRDSCGTLGPGISLASNAEHCFHLRHGCKSYCFVLLLYCTLLYADAMQCRSAALYSRVSALSLGIHVRGMISYRPLIHCESSHSENKRQNKSEKIKIKDKIKGNMVPREKSVKRPCMPHPRIPLSTPWGGEVVPSLHLHSSVWLASLLVLVLFA
jgi:hypothetical protein